MRYTLTATLVLITVLLTGCPRPNGPVRQPDLTFLPDSLPTATVGVAYSQKITAPNSSTPMYALELTGALPDGLTYTYDKDNEFGIIAGTPTEAGSFPITLRGTCFGTQVSGQTGTIAYTLTVNPGTTVAPEPPPQTDTPPAL